MGWLNFDASKVGFEALEKLREELNSWDALDFLDKVRRYFHNDLDSGDKKKIDLAIQVLGLEPQLEKVKALVAKIPPGAWKLFDRLSQVTDRFSLQLLGKDDRFQALDGPWSSKLGFELTSEVGIQAFSARQNIAILPELEVPSGVAYFQVDGVGRLSIEAGGSFAFTGGGVNAGIQAGGQVELAYLFEDEPGTLAVSALLRHGQHLMAPFHLEKIGNAYQHHLRAVQLMAQGNLALNAGLSVGQTWGTEVPVDSDTLEVDTTFGFDASATGGITASVVLAGGYDLLIQPQASGKVSVQLKRSKDRSRSLGINLEAQVAITGLDVIGQAILDKFIPDARPWIAKLTPFQDLGNLVRQKLSEQLGDYLNESKNQALRDQLVKVVTGAGTSESLNQAVMAAVQGEVNEQLDRWTTEAGELSGQVVARAADRLALTGEARTLFIEELTGKLVEGIGAVKSDLRGNLAQWFKEQEGELETLLKPLEAFGAKVGELIGQTQDLADRVLEPVLQFLDRYQTYRGKLQEAVDGAARLKIGLNFSRAYASTESGGVMLDLLIDPRVPQAREFFRQMMWGSFTELMTHLQNASDSNSELPGVALLGGSFSKQLGKTVTTDFSVDFAGIDIGIKTIRDLDLNATWDLAGNILAGSGSAMVQKVSSIGRETRSASFVNLLELAGGTDHLPGKIFSSSVSLALEDERIQIGEIGSYLGSLEKSGLLAEGTTKQAIARYDAMDHKHIGAAISLSFPIQGDDLMTFLDAPADEILLRGFENNLTIFEPKATTRNSVLKFLEQHFQGGTRLDKIKLVLRKANDVRTAERLVTTDPNKTAVRRNSRKVWLYSRNAKVLVNMQEIMKKVAAMPLEGPDREANLKALKQLLNQFNREVARVLKAGGLISQFTNRVPKPTLAFIATLRELSQDRGVPIPLVPVIRWRQDGQQVDEILV